MKDQNVIVCGLGFGDEGKGTITDALVRRLKAKTVVRYNGGPQAGHNVVAPDGTWHCFAQFGAGMLVPGTRTFLSRHMLIELENMAVEAQALESKGVSAPLKRIFLDPECLIITPMQKFVGRMREIARGWERHGSCGMGVGETIRDAETSVGLCVRDILTGKPGLETLRFLVERTMAEAKAMLGASPSDELLQTFGQMIQRSDAETLFYRYRLTLERLSVTFSPCDFLRQELATGPVIFEGAQGALLDRHRGYVPYVTKSDTTRRNAVGLIADTGCRKKTVTLGVLRAYATRHGPGPFVTEDPRLAPFLADPYNRENPWQGEFRVGMLDLVALRYGIAINGGVDALAVTGLDAWSGLKEIPISVSYRKSDGSVPPRGIPDWTVFPGWDEDISGVRRFRELPANARAFIRFLGSADGLGVPVRIVSVGPRADQKIFL